MLEPAPARRFAVVRAPSGLGLRATGVEGLADALLRRGLAEALGARVVASVAPPPPTGVRDPASGVLNGPEVAAYAVALADAVEAVRDAGDVPLVLGGDCSVLLGGTLALRRRGRAGLLFLDGHADFYQPSAEPSGEAASMDLALATGHGPPAVGDLEGRAPLVRAEDTALVGFRDAREQARDGSQPLPQELLALDLAAVHAAGAGRAAAHALAHLTRPGAPGRFWVHVDADILDDAVMPAVDYRQPGGLAPGELATILAAAMATGRVAGVEVTIYNPALDPGGTAGDALAAALVDGLGGAAHRDVVVLDRGRRLRFSLDDLSAYHGVGSPGGVAHALRVMQRAWPLLDPDSPPERRELTIETAFGGPGARDAFELVTRAVTGDRYRVDPALARPERGRARERFVFRIGYRGRSATLWVREGFVTDEFIDLARVDRRSGDQEARLDVLKREMAGRVLGSPAEAVYDAELADLAR